MTLTTKIQLLFVLALTACVPMGVVSAFNFGLAYLLIICAVMLSFGISMYDKGAISKICSAAWLLLFLWPTERLIFMCADGGASTGLAAILEVLLATTVLCIGPPAVRELGKKAGEIKSE